MKRGVSTAYPGAMFPNWEISNAVEDGHMWVRLEVCYVSLVARGVAIVNQNWWRMLCIRSRLSQTALQRKTQGFCDFWFA